MGACRQTIKRTTEYGKDHQEKPESLISDNIVHCQNNSNYHCFQIICHALTQFESARFQLVSKGFNFHQLLTVQARNSSK